jgi:hypothetical protein
MHNHFNTSLSPLDRVLLRLDFVEPYLDGWRGTCPACGEPASLRIPSLKCEGGCRLVDVLDALGMSVTDFLGTAAFEPEQPAKNDSRRPDTLGFGNKGTIPKRPKPVRLEYAGGRLVAR